MWKSYINWEKSNVLQTDDMITLTKRGETSGINALITHNIMH